MATLETEASLCCLHICAELEVPECVCVCVCAAPPPFPRAVEALKVSPPSKVAFLLNYAVLWQLFSFFYLAHFWPACSDRPRGMKGSR